jgi:hypothetical protein
MKRLWILLLLVCGFAIDMSAQPLAILQYIQRNSDIKEGGCNIYSYNNESYLICVSQVIVGTKNEATCQTVGAAKAKRDMSAFVNGSDITSFTELKTTETIEETLSGKSHQLKQEYVDIIKENVVGSINQCSPLGSWFSDDKSVYYYALYKIINK